MTILVINFLHICDGKPRDCNPLNQSRANGELSCGAGKNWHRVTHC